LYYFPEQPPYMILAFGIFAALTSGIALGGTLKSVVAQWQSSGAENSGTQIAKKALFLPFLGIGVGITLFLVSGLEIFGFPPFISFAVGLPIALFTILLVWFQLGSMMTFVETNGMRSLDLDSMN
jgi:hypothetical protein